MNKPQLYAPVGYGKMSKAQKEKLCNGCGTKGLGGWLVPDTLYGLNITEACNIHDWMYFKGKDIYDKEEADRVFLNNMLRIISRGSSWLKWLRRRRAYKYYDAVVMAGGPAFWDNKNKPGEMT